MQNASRPPPPPPALAKEPPPTKSPTPSQSQPPLYSPYTQTHRHTRSHSLRDYHHPEVWCCSFAFAHLIIVPMTRKERGCGHAVRRERPPVSLHLPSLDSKQWLNDHVLLVELTLKVSYCTYAACLQLLCSVAGEPVFKTSC